ncbi:hypothetical protein LXL04_039620 [Taraxacum kok-saghyz]
MFPLRLYETLPATGYSIVLRPPVAPSRFSLSSAACFCGTPTSPSPSFLRTSDYPVVAMMNLLGSKLSTNPNVYYIKSSVATVKKKVEVQGICGLILTEIGGFVLTMHRY